MALVSAVYGGYMSVSDLNGQEWELTIAGALDKEFPVEKEGVKMKEQKIALTFQETGLKMVLNVTNATALANSLGDDTDDWGGHKVVVWPDPNVMYGGKKVGGLKIEAATARTSRAAQQHIANNGGQAQQRISHQPQAQMQPAPQRQREPAPAPPMNRPISQRAMGRGDGRPVPPPHDDFPGDRPFPGNGNGNGQTSAEIDGDYIPTF